MRGGAKVNASRATRVGCVDVDEVRICSYSFCFLLHRCNRFSFGIRKSVKGKQSMLVTAHSNQTSAHGHSPDSKFRRARRAPERIIVVIMEGHGPRTYTLFGVRGGRAGMSPALKEVRVRLHALAQAGHVPRARTNPTDSIAKETGVLAKEAFCLAPFS